MVKKNNKGQEMEEALRNYFLKAGYYVARGVPFKYEGFDVTDIDLWLYSRTSPIARNISIVDIKNKKTPQAIERIFWVKGLGKAVNADSTTVATTDRRKEVKEFGKDLGVVVLDGLFMSKLSKSPVSSFNRLTDEGFLEIIESYNLSKLDGDWKGKIINCKGLLAKGLTFDSCNQWIEVARFFAEQIITKPTQVDVALRCFYLSLSFLAVGVDFMLRELSFLDNKDRKEKLAEGFTYGSKGKDGLDKMLNLSLNLVEQFSSEGTSLSSQVKSEVLQQFDSLPTQILGEYFGNNEVGKTLFDVARELESLSMCIEFNDHAVASMELRSLIGCALDFWSISRKDFNDASKMHNK